MQNYDISYDDKYGQLAQIDVAAEGQGNQPWLKREPFVLGVHQGVTIPRGVSHRPHARTDARSC